MPSGSALYWTQERIEAEIRPLAEKLGHFPSSSELREHGRNDIACALSKYGGYLAWAKRLGYPRIASDSDFGWAGEAKAAEMFRAAGFPVEMSQNVKSPHDLLVCEVLRVDVKSASFADYGNNCKGWFYRIGKLPQADLLFFVQMDIDQFFAMPWYMSPQGNITLSKSPNSKYAKYQNNWQVIRRMIQMRQIERAFELGQIQEVA
jgi:hypothetical protein